MGEWITIGLALCALVAVARLWRRAMLHQRRRADRVSRAWLDRNRP